MWESWKSRVYNYFDKSVGGGWAFPIVGAALFLATVVLSLILASDQDDGYYAVAGLTGLAGITVAIDFAGVKSITPLTVTFGSTALFVGQSLWADDRTDFLRALLFGIQLCAVGIQIGAIANSNGRAAIDSGVGVVRIG